MHPKVNEVYQEWAKKYQMQGPFLEIGVIRQEESILCGKYFEGKSERFATNLSAQPLAEEIAQDQIRFVCCNSQNMREVFADDHFATVLSNAVLEHDKYFWRSLDEMKRVLAPGGLIAIGAPGYIPRKMLHDDIISPQVKSATATMDMHHAPDYWRFSRHAFKEVICEGLEILETRIVGKVPVLLALARKPLNGLLPPVPQEARRAAMEIEQAERQQKREAEDAARAARGEKPRTTGPQRLAEAKQRKAKRQMAQARPAPLPEAQARASQQAAKANRLREREAKAQARAARREARQEKLAKQKPAATDEA